MNSQLLEKPLPSSPENERAILGGILIDNSLLSQVLRRLSPGDLYSPSHRRIFNAMVRLSERGSEINTVLLGEELRHDNSLESMGGLPTLANLTFGVPHLSNLERYIDIVLEKSKLRQIVKHANSIMSQALDEEDGSATVIDRALDALSSIATENITTCGGVGISSLLPPQIDRFRAFHRNASDSIPTGFKEIDLNITGRGLMRSQLHYLAARPSMGKTALALDIAANAAEAGHRVYFASLEMSKEVLLDRLFAVNAGIARWKLQPGLSNLDLERLESSAPDFERWGLFVDDSSRSTAQMNRAIRQVLRHTPVDLIIVDYLQLVDTGRVGTRNDAVGANSRALQAMAKEFGAAVLCLSQLSRECEKQVREPELRDLRDSGEIEQDGRTIFFLFGDRGEEDITDSNTPHARPTFREITLKCAKQGEGKLFRVTFSFNSQLVTFRTAGNIISGIRHDAFSAAS